MLLSLPGPSSPEGAASNPDAEVLGFLGLSGFKEELGSEEKSTMD